MDMVMVDLGAKGGPGESGKRSATTRRCGATVGNTLCGDGGWFGDGAVGPDL